MEVKIKRYKSGENSGCIRKNEVKLDRYDSWSADWTIAQIAHPLLVQLKEKKQCAPCVDDEDVPEHLRSYSCASKENEWDTDANWFKRWDYVLDEIIFAMQEVANDNENEPNMYKHIGDIEFGEIDEATGLGEIKSLGVERIPEMEESNRQYHERVQRGCVLFGKYFQNLWS